MTPAEWYDAARESSCNVMFTCSFLIGQRPKDNIYVIGDFLNDIVYRFFGDTLKVQPVYLDNTIQDFNGGFLYPDIMHKNNIIIDNTDINPNNYMSIDVGKDMTIPLTFEYCLNNTSGDNSKPISTIKKSIYFEI
jgi:hypothetical protein